MNIYDSLKANKLPTVKLDLSRGGDNIRDSIADQMEELELIKAQREELDRCLASWRSILGEKDTWENVKHRILSNQ